MCDTVTCRKGSLHVRPESPSGCLGIVVRPPAALSSRQQPLLEYVLWTMQEEDAPHVRNIRHHLVPSLPKQVQSRQGNGQRVGNPSGRARKSSWLSVLYGQKVGTSTVPRDSAHHDRSQSRRSTANFNSLHRASCFKATASRDRPSLAIRWRAIGRLLDT